MIELYFEQYNYFMESAKDSEKRANESDSDYDKCLWIDGAIEEYENAKYYLEQAFMECKKKDEEFEKHSGGRWFSNMNIEIITKLIGLKDSYYRHAKDLF